MRPWWLRLARYGRPYRFGFALVILLIIASVALNALKPWPLKLIIDYILTGEPLPEMMAWLTVLPGGTSSTALLAWLAGSTVALFLAGQVVRATKAYIQAGIGNRMIYDLGAELFDHLQQLSLRLHGRHATGDLVRRVTTDTHCVRDLWMGVAFTVFASLASLITMFTVMWQLNPSLALLALLVAAPMGVLIKVFAGSMKGRNYQQQQLEGKIMALAEQTLTALPVVQGFGREAHQDMHFRNLSQQTIQASLRAVGVQLQFKVGVNAATAVGTAVMMLLGGFQVLQGSLSVGGLLVFLAYMASLYSPLETLAYLSSGFATAAAKARRVLEILDMDEGVRDQPGARVLAPCPRGERGHIQLLGVTFGYEPGTVLLKDLDLEVRPGETVALVGPTGAGKSTLVSLIPRFFDPWEGQVTLDGIDIRDIQLTSLRAQVALVLQEPFLLPLSIAENIAYGRPGASREEIVAAAVAASADPFIQRLPQGYDTVIGERGATLSGGERQRLAIARAFLKDAPILILDEPTSALDAQTEAQVMGALTELMQGRTTFIIAHRLSTIRQASRIAVLEAGRLVEQGTHQELLANGGLYQRLHSGSAAITA